MQGVMNIPSKLNDTQRAIFDNLSLGVIEVNLKNRINRINTYMEKLINDSTMDLIAADIENILKDPVVNEVKQTLKYKEKKDYLLSNQLPVITCYHPLLDKQKKLTGVIIVIELYSVIHQRLQRYTDYETYQQILAIVKRERTNQFRVLKDDDTTWFMSNGWNEEWSAFNEETARKIDNLSKKTIKYRRDIEEEFLLEKNQSLTPMKLISKPLLIKGKLIGSIQFLYVKFEKYYQEEIEQLKRLVRNLEKTKKLKDLTGKGTEIKLAFEQAKLLKNLKAPLTIIGERGTGKTTLAKAIHLESSRRNNPFIIIDTSCLMENERIEELLSEIRRKSRNGTVYVRVQSALTDHTQKRLLRLIQECSGTHIIFGVLPPIEKIGLKGQLIQLLQHYQIMLPPLRNRTEDIPLLAEEILFYLNDKYHMNINKIEDQVIEHWQKQDWPNNIIQLQSELEKIIANLDTHTEVLTFDQLTDRMREPSIISAPGKKLPLQQAIDQFEKEYITNALQSNHYNKTKTAQSLNISVRNLYYKMDKYKINRGGT